MVNYFVFVSKRFLFGCFARNPDRQWHSYCTLYESFFCFLLHHTRSHLFSVVWCQTKECIGLEVRWIRCAFERLICSWCFWAEVQCKSINYFVWPTSCIVFGLCCVSCDTNAVGLKLLVSQITSTSEIYHGPRAPYCPFRIFLSNRTQLKFAQCTLYVMSQHTLYPL